MGRRRRPRGTPAGSATIGAATASRQGADAGEAACCSTERRCYMCGQVWHKETPRGSVDRRGARSGGERWEPSVASRIAVHAAEQATSLGHPDCTAGADNVARKQNDRKRTCGRLQSFPSHGDLVAMLRAGNPTRLHCSDLPPGATMPQDAPGAVGEHGCRRREPDPTLRHRKVRSSTTAAAGSPPAKW